MRFPRADLLTLLLLAQEEEQEEGEHAADHTDMVKQLPVDTCGGRGLSCGDLVLQALRRWQHQTRPAQVSRARYWTNDLK